MSNFRMLTDAINIKAAYIVNVGVNFQIIPKPNANSNEVVLRCVDRLKLILHNDRMQINGSIDLSGLISELDNVEGVQSVAHISLYNINETGYSNTVYDIPSSIKNNIIYPSLDPMIFEIKYPNLDIKGRAIKP